MNYGDRREIWSACSNQDFKRTYSRIFIERGNGGFCLKDLSELECKCNGKTDIGGGECKTESDLGRWCYVDSNSGCKDKREFFSAGYISVSACATKAKGCKDDQWQCKTSKSVFQRRRDATS
eukprot:TRINITY_DN36369_c0_g1_i1.p1 TRINITY_DN36369_c0_g1~~TRINITY_DN36369_c0_g1_i1.p1  ORF type:complete len:122 (-),score=21.08 TRINITY_DN36369_c0_g1_i1:10-375(-)